jgi:hypothetical protein
MKDSHPGQDNGKVYSKIGGWLILFAFGLVLYPVQTLFLLVTELSAGHFRTDRQQRLFYVFDIVNCMVLSKTPTGSRAGIFFSGGQYYFCQHRLFNHQFFPYPRQLDECGYHHKFCTHGGRRINLDSLFHVFPQGQADIHQISKAKIGFTNPKMIFNKDLIFGSNIPSVASIESTYSL